MAQATHHATSTGGGEGSDCDSSFSSRRSFESSSSMGTESAASCGSYKPHKANQAEWEAIGHIRAMSGRVGFQHFELIRRLGGGDLGNVYLCRLRDPKVSGCLFAMKVVDKDAAALRDKLRRAAMEKNILRAVDHPFLPTLYAAFEVSHYSCIVTEFCSGGDLFVSRQRQPRKRFSISAAKFYAAEVLLALEYLHVMGVVYRDLKPENVLIRDDGHIMLTDFDLSMKCDSMQPRRLLFAEKNPKSSALLLYCFYGGRISVSSTCNKKSCTRTNESFVAEPRARSNSFVGTHEYLAPEVISGVGHGSAVDWWTLGVLLYEMVYGRTPFKGDDNEKTLANIMKQQLRFPKVGEGLEETRKVQELIRRLLVKDPKKRIGGCMGSVEIKRHEFFRGVNWALIRSTRPPLLPKDSREKHCKKKFEDSRSVPQSFGCF